MSTKICWLMCACLMVLSACNDNTTGSNSELEPSRQFTPGEIQANSQITTVKLTWNPALYTTEKNETYTVIVSEDSLFQSDTLYTVQTDTAGVTFNDTQIETHKKYFARVKTNKLGNSDESHYTQSKGFSIRGAQIFLPVYQPEVKATSAKLRWQDTTKNLTSIKLQRIQGKINPQPVGDPVTVDVTSEDIQAGSKTVEELQENARYEANIYQSRQGGNSDVSVGSTSFMTPKKLIYAQTLSSGADLGMAIDNSVDGDVIGLNPGTYTLDSGTDIEAKSITLASTSGDPTDTKVNFEKFELKDTGAGITFKGLELDGGGNSYFVNLVSSDGNSTPADFKNIVVENCHVHNTSHTILRGNRGNNSDFSIDTLRIDNSLMYDEQIAGYNYLTLGGMIFKSVELTNSTFYNIGRKFVGWKEDIDKSLSFTPRIVINHCTINDFGAAGKDNLLIDAGDNTVNINLTNTIMANIPLPGATVDSPLLGAEGEGSTVNVTNDNFFNLTNGNGEDLTFPDYNYLTMQIITHTDLGWTDMTTGFSLPEESSLRSQSTSGGPIGDPRWIY